MLAPAAAPPKFAVGALHAYLGADPFAGRPRPSTVGTGESLAAYVIVTLNPAAPSRGRRSALSRRPVGGGGPRDRSRVPRVPVSRDAIPPRLPPARRSRRRGGRGHRRDVWTGAPLRVRAAGSGAEGLVPPALRSSGPDWDAAVELAEVSSLWAQDAVGPNGGVGVPWLKAGWHQAYLALRDGVQDRGARGGSTRSTSASSPTAACPSRSG